MTENNIIDLRSDTVTRPSKSMHDAMVKAELGDDVYGDDPTVNRLEAVMAERVGMEAALLVTSGTQSNLTALMSHLARGEEFIVGSGFHICKYEAGGAAVLGSLVPHPLSTPADGRLDLNAVIAAIRPDDSHFAITRLLCLENTYNGVPIELEYQNKLADAAHQRGLNVHLDGARLFNACTALDISAQQLCEKVDSVSICLSKGLGAPMGSVLCGSGDFIARARRIRKMLGGGLRQAGIIAACGLVALEEEVPRLGDDHKNAARLAQGLATIDSLEISPMSAKTNMVFVTPPEERLQSFRDHLAEHGILTGDQSPTMRFVTHRDIDSEGIERVIDATGSYFHT
ncbi:MAG: threonine aldolase [marine bacterium B5-7]|nr:MAG: threonine aldolase [marine bacterium B5-7]